MSALGSNLWRSGVKVGLGLVVTLWVIQGAEDAAPALAGDSRHAGAALQRHVLPLKGHSGGRACLGRFTKQGYGTQIFRTRFHRPASPSGARPLMVHVDVGERYPVIINTIQIRHGRERVAYHIGRRMGQGWNVIQLDHIPWRRGELIVSFNHGRGSRVGLFWGHGGLGFPHSSGQHSQAKPWGLPGHQTKYNLQYY